MEQKFILFITLLFFVSCSQKAPTIDGQAGKFAHHFYPAKTDNLYIENSSVSKKYPLIFLFEGFYGEWRKYTIVMKLQRLGYNVVTIGYFDKSGISNNLSRINLNALKTVMDSYKNNHGVDSEAIGVIGRGKGGELVLVLGSLYPDIKMVVSIVGSHVVVQSSQINLAHHSSWVHNGKELDFVPFPLASLATIKGAITLLFGGKGYNQIHLNAFKNKEAVEKARIKVENINGSVYILADRNDEFFPSVLMGKEIMQRLKEKKFVHHYEYKDYNSSWYLQSHSEEWNHVYKFVTNNLKSKYTSSLFNHIDKNNNKKISIDEYIDYIQKLKEKNRLAYSTRVLYNCDKNYDKKIDFYEVKEKQRPYIESNGVCPIFQNNFYHFDTNSDKVITEEELSQQKEPLQPYLSQDFLQSYEDYDSKNNKLKIEQCDTNLDEKLTKKEALSIQCQIPIEVFNYIDSNKNNFLTFNEIKNIPTKYIALRSPFYVQNKNDKVSYTINIISAISPMAIMECDTNQNNSLDEREATSKSCGFTHEEFYRDDRNRDGIYSDKDLVYFFYLQSFKKLDSNKDGFLNFDESLEIY